ncbi:crotonobetainyl-CoA:carnitine CoA-transferase CaiB-like acyl-CoA transferase [Bosea sp. BE125]|uniref:CoA transferase n=1 Tax=Bosea sp. BE125 TaxID=2817909 RepID=UPI0028582BEC|nr:CoA transferase [Bosea sp. BE125]MDR6874114.1 crotonobetainyl-CoA:carnitine CoA-transferase CaiB-like acyl-CoA transferase [Bosea sp. BE125]
MLKQSNQQPLAGVRVVECSHGVAAAYCGRLLSVMGAEVILLEPQSGHRLRREPPFLAEAPDTSALFSYLAAGKQSVICDLAEDMGRAELDALLADADILIDDTPIAERRSRGLDPDDLSRRFPKLIPVSVLPFGAHGPKAGWRAEEINAIHATGEGFLLPNGLSVELFPDRPPLKIYGHFTAMQGGVAAALAALSALWAEQGQSADISVQDAGLAVACFAVQRLGDGSLEHRVERSFKYGGVLECRDGFVEVLTLEERQWTAMVELMGHPAWATDKALDDALERSRRGAEINRYIRAWARDHDVVELVGRAQRLGVPMARYNAPADILCDPHEQARGLFQPVEIPGVGTRSMLVAPFHFGGSPLRLASGPPALGEHRLAAPAIRARKVVGAAE